MQVVSRRAERSLVLKRARLHVVNGFLTAVGDLNAVVKAIRAARDGKAAKAALQQKWSLDEEQAEAVLNLSLRRLTGLAIDELRKEAATLGKDISSLEKLLASKVRYVSWCTGIRTHCTCANALALSVIGDAVVQKKILSVVVKEAETLTAKYGRPRRTELADASVADVATDEDLIPDEKGLIIFSSAGHIKRVADTTFTSQVRSLPEHRPPTTRRWQLAALSARCHCAEARRQGKAGRQAGRTAGGRLCGPGPAGHVA